MFILSSVAGIQKGKIQGKLCELGYSVIQCDAESREKEFTDGVAYALSMEKNHPEKDIIFWIRPEAIASFKIRFPLLKLPIVGLRALYKNVEVYGDLENAMWSFDMDDLSEAGRKGYCKNLNIEDYDCDPETIAKAIDKFFMTGVTSNAMDN